jgi:hypothetical protein
MKRRLPTRLGLVLVGLFAAMQLVPLSRQNPPVEQDLGAPPAVDAILRRACYDCHSNETVWPWYAYVAPASFLVAHDVNEGREHLNLSTWNRLSPDQRREALEEMWEEVDEGNMPLPIYLPLHPEARLTDADRAALAAWVSGAAAP